MTPVATRLAEALVIQSAMLDQLGLKHLAAEARRAACNWRMAAVLED